MVSVHFSWGEKKWCQFIFLCRWRKWCQFIFLCDEKMEWRKMVSVHFSLHKKSDKMVSLHFSLGGRPRGRGINSMFRRSATCSVHCEEPKGRPLRSDQKWCQFIFLWGVAHVGEELTRCSGVRPFVPSIGRSRRAGRCGASRAPTSTQLRFDRPALWLAIVGDVPPRCVQVPATRGRGSAVYRRVRGHGMDSLTIDNRQGLRPCGLEAGWPQCTAEPLVSACHPESRGS